MPLWVAYIPKDYGVKISISQPVLLPSIRQSVEYEWDKMAVTATLKLLFIYFKSRTLSTGWVKPVMEKYARIFWDL